VPMPLLGVEVAPVEAEVELCEDVVLEAVLVVLGVAVTVVTAPVGREEVLVVD